MADLTIIRDVCKEQGITLKKLAEKLSISETGLHRIIKSNSTKIETLEKIANILDISLLDFFPDENVKDYNNFLILDFLGNKYNMVLTLRYDKFSDKLSYFLDSFIVKILEFIKDDNEDIVKLRYPLPIENRPKFIFSNDDLIDLKSLYIEANKLPYSKWSIFHQTILKNKQYLFESFYFTFFYLNILNVNDYLNDEMLQNNELLFYWKEWKKINKEVLNSNIRLEEEKAWKSTSEFMGAISLKAMRINFDKFLDKEQE